VAPPATRFAPIGVLGEMCSREAGMVDYTVPSPPKVSRESLPPRSRLALRTTVIPFSSNFPHRINNLRFHAHSPAVHSHQETPRLPCRCPEMGLASFRHPVRRRNPTGRPCYHPSDANQNQRLKQRSHSYRRRLRNPRPRGCRLRPRRPNRHLPLPLRSIRQQTVL